VADHLVIALNFTPVTREGYRIGVPSDGPYEEILSSDSSQYGGSGVDNGGRPLSTEPVDWMNRPRSLVVRLPPLGGIVLRPAPSRAVLPEAGAAEGDSETTTGADGDADR
jgi:1,4-alpha-glucan branching enzyme